MIILMYNTIEETFYDSKSALKRIRVLESQGEVVSWRCDYPEDNEYLWRYHG